MNCSSCLSTEYLIKDDFTFECEFCLSPIENDVIDDFLEQFKNAYLHEQNLSSVINDFFEEIKHLSFPFLIRDYVQSNYNYSVIASEIRKLPIYEVNQIRDITGSNTRVGFSFVRSSEIIDQIVLHQDSIPDLKTRIELLAVTLASEKGSFPYQSMDDLEFLYMDPNASEVINQFKKEIKSLGSKFESATSNVTQFLSNKLKTQSKYLEECTSASKFTTKQFNHGLAITNCSDKGKIIRIPPVIHGKIVLRIESNAFVSNLASAIEIPFTINDIQPNAFNNQQALEVIKMGNQTPLRANMFVNCPLLHRIELIQSHGLKNVDGIIYSSDLRQLIYFPPALPNATLTIDQSLTIKQGSCYQAKYLRNLVVNATNVIIESDAFRMDEQTSLTIESIKQIKKLSKLNHSTDKQELLESIRSEDPEMVVEAFRRLSDHDFESYHLRAKAETEEADKIKYLILAFEAAQNYIDQAKALDELLKFEDGVAFILKSNIDEPYLYYYIAMARNKSSYDDQEKILQLFLDSYHAGNYRAGINASTLLKNGVTGIQDFSMAERILIDLKDKHHLDAKLKLISLYSDQPQLCTKDITSLVQELKTSHLEEFLPLYAELLYKGTLIPQDVPQAVEFMEALSDKGNKNASYQLGIIYYSDKDFKDMTKAKTYFNKAHLQGHKEAKRAILKILE